MMKLALLVFGAMIALLAFGTLVKYWEVRKAMRWLRTEGRITHSAPTSRRVRTVQTHAGAQGSGDREVRNFADIRYEYAVNGKRFKGQRVSIGEDLGNFRVAETLARYPVGKAVVVHYNPENPAEAVLENEAPEGIWGTMAGFIAVMAVLLIGGTVGFDRLLSALKAGSDRAPEVLTVALALAGMALFVGLLAFVLQRQQAAARHWLNTQGTVVRAAVERFWVVEAADADAAGSTWRRLLMRADVEYSYTVAGVVYNSNRIALGGKFYASRALLVRGAARRLRAGEAVQVFYNPDDPAEAVLEPRAVGLGLLWGVAALLLAVAAWVWFS